MIFGNMNRKNLNFIRFVINETVDILLLIRFHEMPIAGNDKERMSIMSLSDITWNKVLILVF